MVSIMRLIYSISFRKSEKKLLKYAVKRSYGYNGFSEYIKILILQDKEKMENIFTKEEREEIKRIIEEIINNNG